MDQVITCNRELNKYIKGDIDDKHVVIDILLALEKMNMNYDILKQTKVGQTVQKLRKHKEEEISTKAKFLIRKWKTIALSPRESTLPPKTTTQTTSTIPKRTAFLSKPIGLSSMREKVRQKLVETLSREPGDAESAATEVGDDID